MKQYCIVKILDESVKNWAFANSADEALVIYELFLEEIKINLEKRDYKGRVYSAGSAYIFGILKNETVVV